ncbi:hypothetical protein [Aidingimonas lacisalsi]|uniref:hypothetical protein n=1 Tax=Aidingimonas lacisalsi TaxID=2604086 RepID=UPI0011D1E45F|nr:hypothetical protein [Aidingimonas lacisalsi]
MTYLPDTSETYAVDPTRLAMGRWCHRAERTIGEGDIHASYSADHIGMGRPVRPPFSWKGALWTCVGTGYGNGDVVSAKAYRLVPVRLFDGTPVTYAVKTRDAGTARADANGFYHGMLVKSAGKSFVLCGPPALFVPGRSEQMSLF